MSRIPRKISESGCYHVILRGNGKQIIFEDDKDRRKFLALLQEVFADASVVVFAWCLMDNHVHLCLRDDSGDCDTLARAMHRLGMRYAMYFNAKSGHSGHVFQDRYRSEPIEDEAYLLETVRYIHNNPEKAGLCSADEYRWSSYQEYVGEPIICETSGILEALGGPEGFKEFMSDRTATTFLPAVERRTRISDEETAKIAAQVLPSYDIADIKSLPKEQRDKVLRLLKAQGISARQLERLTGIGRYVISNIRQE